MDNYLSLSVLCYKNKLSLEKMCETGTLVQRLVYQKKMSNREKVMIVIKKKNKKERKTDN